MVNKGVSIEIKSDSIYMHSLAKLCFKSDTEFSMSTNLEIIDIYKGKINDDGNLMSELGDFGRFYIELSVLGFFQEREVDENLKGKIGNHYGMRFYPFISSVLKGRFKISQKVNSIIIDLPDMFRLIFLKSIVYQNRSIALLRHSYGDHNSSFVFTWEKTIVNSNLYLIDFKVPVRFGGTSFLRMVKFPIYYWLIAMLGIALLSITEKTNVVIGAVATTWLFMLQRWNNSNLPQQNTLLTRFYLIYGIVLGIWGVCWKLCSYWASFLAIPICIMTILSLKAINQFNLYGKLPNYIAKWNANKVVKLDEKIKNNFE